MTWLGWLIAASLALVAWLLDRRVKQLVIENTEQRSELVRARKNEAAGYRRVENLRHPDWPKGAV